MQENKVSPIDNNGQDNAANGSTSNRRSNNNTNDNRNSREQRPNKNNRFQKKEKQYEEQVIEIKSVVKVNKGGRQRRFSATVVVGDRKGQVGLGIGKANEVPDAIKKAIQAANKNIIKIPITDGRTIAHEVNGTAGAAKVMLKPASEGTGVIAGGAVRAVLELAGIHDILSKSLGSRTKNNMANATIDALKQIRTPEMIAKLRGKTKEEILG